MRQLIIILGDQLNLDCVLPDNYDPAQDGLWMAESGVEARRVWSHKARIALFFSAMRHFRDAVIAAGHPLEYLQSDSENLAPLLAASLREKPQKVVLTRPGDWHVLEELKEVLEASGIPWALREDPHFISTPLQFGEWAEGRKEMRMEYFYRGLRQQTGYLMTENGKPEGDRWNFDADNRRSFGKQGPGFLPPIRSTPPDDLTRKVLTEVEQRFSNHPGKLETFDWPVTREDALETLQAFVTDRLPMFGTYQDAMWLGETWLFHSRLAAALNLHLLDPREVIDAAITAYREGKAPLAATEGFVRQILGWREFVRGLYWLKMPDWKDANFFEAQNPLPDFYWTGETEMACLRDALRSTLDTGYAHHIQRLMVTGLFALLLGVRPTDVEAWFHAIYVDAVSWVELPNTVGMSQFADGGALASKPYVASGSYIDRMSNSCPQCPYQPKERHGENACPFTVLYWDFLSRHETKLRPLRRMAMQLRNLDRLSAEERLNIRENANEIRLRYS